VVGLASLRFFCLLQPSYLPVTLNVYNSLQFGMLPSYASRLFKAQGFYYTPYPHFHCISPVPQVLHALHSASFRIAWAHPLISNAYSPCHSFEWHGECACPHVNAISSCSLHCVVGIAGSYIHGLAPRFILVPYLLCLHAFREELISLPCTHKPNLYFLTHFLS